MISAVIIFFLFCALSVVVGVLAMSLIDGELGVIIGVLIFFFGASFPVDEYFEQKRNATPVYETKTIVSLRGSTQIEGSFLLGTGSFQGVPVYYYYTRRGEGLILETAYAEEAVVIETSSSPHIKYYNRRCNEGVDKCWDENQDIVTEVHVPPSTVKKKYDVVIN